MVHEGTEIQGNPNFSSCAIKIVDPESLIPRESLKEIWEREAEISYRLSEHPNIVTSFGLGSLEYGDTCIVYGKSLIRIFLQIRKGSHKFGNALCDVRFSS